MTKDRLEQRATTTKPVEDIVLDKLARLYGLPERTVNKPHNLFERCLESVDEIWRSWPSGTRAEYVKRAFTPPRREAVMARLAHDTGVETAVELGLSSCSLYSRIDRLQRDLDYPELQPPDPLTCAAIEGISAGELPPDTVSQVRRYARQQENPLTGHQLTTLETIVREGNRKKAASVLKVSPITVSTTMHRIAKKYGLPGRSGRSHGWYRAEQVVAEAARRGDLDPQDAKEFLASRLLTPDQLEVVSQLNRGSPLEEIADNPDHPRSYSTVVTHLHKARKRLGAPDNRALLHSLGDLGVIDTSKDTLYARTRKLTPIKEAAEKLRYHPSWVQELAKKLSVPITRVTEEEGYLDLNELAERLLETGRIGPDHPFFRNKTESKHI